MKRGFGRCAFWAVAVATLLLVARPANAQSQLDPSKPGLTMCKGPFALCAAATCKLTGNQFPGKSAPEVVCTCPVLPGPALADVNQGNMQGNCLAPVDPATNKKGVWSLFWPNLNIPQQVNGVWRRNVAALPHNCPSTSGEPAQPVLFGQCFSYSCKNVRRVNGVLVADCYCPAQHILDPGKHEFAVQAGQCKASVCSKIPVGAPFTVMGEFCKIQD